MFGEQMTMFDESPSSTNRHFACNTAILSIRVSVRDGCSCRRCVQAGRAPWQSVHDYGSVEIQTGIDLRRSINKRLHSPRARRERCRVIPCEADSSQREFYSSGQNASMVFCGIQRWIVTGVCRSAILLRCLTRPRVRVVRGGSDAKKSRLSQERRFASRLAESSASR